jgi:hypothetical protein
MSKLEHKEQAFKDAHDIIALQKNEAFKRYYLRRVGELCEEALIDALARLPAEGESVEVFELRRAQARERVFVYKDLLSMLDRELARCSKTAGV